MKLKIGTEVTVKRTVSFGYDDDNNRIMNFNNITEGTYCLIGIRHKPMGKYHSSKSYSGNWINDEPEFIPAYLEVTSTVKVALVVRSLSNKPLTVLYSDVEDQLNEAI